MSATLDAIDQLEGLLSGGRRIPLTGNVIVDEELALDLIDHARLQLPEDLVEAQAIVEERQRLVEDAQRVAEEMLDGARREAGMLLDGAKREAQEVQRRANDRAAQLVDDHVITRQAQERTSTLLVEAKAEAARVSAQADAYAREVLGRLESDLERLGTGVRRGLEALPDPVPRSGRRR